MLSLPPAFVLSQDQTLKLRIRSFGFTVFRSKLTRVMYTRQPCDRPIIILVFQNVDTPKYQCETIQNPKASSEPRRHPPSTFLFLLNQQCQKPDETNSVSRPNIPVKPGSAFPQNCERNRYLMSVNRSVKSQTFERAPQPPEATAPPRSMKRVIGPTFRSVNEENRPL